MTFKSPLKLVPGRLYQSRRDFVGFYDENDVITKTVVAGEPWIFLSIEPYTKLRDEFRMTVLHTTGIILVDFMLKYLKGQITLAREE